MISAPLSVSCNWATSMSFGPRPALSKAARAASIVGVSPLSTERAGENTSKLFSGLVFTAADLNLTCVRHNSRAFFPEERLSATPPSQGLQNINCVRGSLFLRAAKNAPWREEEQGVGTWCLRTGRIRVLAL